MRLFFLFLFLFLWPLTASAETYHLEQDAGGREYFMEPSLAELLKTAKERCRPFLKATNLERLFSHPEETQETDMTATYRDRFDLFLTQFRLLSELSAQVSTLDKGVAGCSEEMEPAWKGLREVSEPFWKLRAQTLVVDCEQFEFNEEAWQDRTKRVRSRGFKIRK